MNETTGTSTAVPRTLYLRLNGRNFSFSRYEARREPYFEFSEPTIDAHAPFKSNLRHALATDPLLSAPVERVQVIVAGPVTPLPLADFQEEDCETIYNYCFAATAPRRIFYDVVAATSTVLLFALEEEICKAVEEVFDCPVHYLSSFTPLLRHFASKPEGTGTHTRIYIYCRNHETDVMAFTDNRLAATNTFPVSAAADVAFHALSLGAQLTKNAADAAYHLVADTSEQRDEVLNELRQYTHNAYAINPAAEFNRHPVAIHPGISYDLLNCLMS